VESFTECRSKEGLLLHLTGVEGVDTQEYWITKDCGSRSWIGEEGPSSRDHTGQGEERTKAYTGGFQQKEATRECWSVQELSIQVFHTHPWGHRGDSHRHPWVTVGKVMDIHGSQKRQVMMPRKVCQN
jgi:hypothetical protein